VTLRAPLAVSAGAGCVCGALLGAFRTREAALALFAKNQALYAAGVPPLPGPEHWPTLTSWAAPGTGALFFGLSLGLGSGVLCGLWVAATRSLPRPFRSLSWAVLAPSLWAALQSDFSLAAMLLAVSAAALAAQAFASPERGGPRLLAAACWGVAGLGLLPLANAPEGAFTRVRDGVLLSSRAGLAVNEFYYRWTLYPAEALKPLEARSQITWVASENLPEVQALTSDATAAGLFRVSAPKGADIVALSGCGQGVELRAEGAVSCWSPGALTRGGALAELSRHSDRAAALRKATSLALYWGGPLALVALLGNLSIWATAAVPSNPARGVAALSLAALLAAGVAYAASSDAALAEARAAAGGTPLPNPASAERLLESPRPVERLYGARAAGRLGPGMAPLLRTALRDPVVNVRYTAAQALGDARDPNAREDLLAVLTGGEAWYVKERAYFALLRLGWQFQRN
jgi:hypothetical protein